MPERFTGDARQVVVCASEQARRLGHGFIGGEHLLYGLASAGGEVGAVLASGASRLSASRRSSSA